MSSVCIISGKFSRILHRNVLVGHLFTSDTGTLYKIQITFSNEKYTVSIQSQDELYNCDKDIQDVNVNLMCDNDSG